MDRALSSKLSLVSAPAGFGKSTVVAEWLDRQPNPAAWVSLDARDNDPILFWSYVISALQQAKPGIGSAALEVLGSSGLTSLEAVVTDVSNDLLRLSENITLVLDDYHTIHPSSPVQSQVRRLLDYQPHSLHLIVLTRSDPPFPLAKLRTQGQLLELRASELQFTVGEASRLLNDEMDLGLGPDDVAALRARTEGWVTGLYLAGLSLEAEADRKGCVRRFEDSHDFVLGYLSEQVLSSLPNHLRNFLIQTSILDLMNAQLCRQVTQMSDSARLIDDIRERGLFLIEMDSTGQWYRYHHLFAEVLRAMLLREMPDAPKVLYSRAAQWCNENGYWAEAVSYALRSGDGRAAKALILQYWRAAVHRGNVQTVLRWLDALPQEIVTQDPAVALARCWVYHLGGHTLSIEPYLTQVESAIEVSKDEPGASTEDQLVLAQVQMLRSVLASAKGNPAAALPHAEAAVALAPEHILHASGPAWNLLAVARLGRWDVDGALEAFQRGIRLAFEGGNLLSACTSTFGLSVYLTYQGRLNDAISVCLAAIDRLASIDQQATPAAGLLQIALARAELERWGLDAAIDHLDHGKRIAVEGGVSEATRYGRYIAAHLDALRGDTVGALRMLEEAERIVRLMDDDYLLGELCRERTSLLLLTEMPGAERSLRGLENLVATTRNPTLRLSAAWMRARILCDHGAYDRALSTIDEVAGIIRDAKNLGELVRIQAIRAVLLNGANHRTAAMEALEEGLTIGMPQNFIRRWLDAGPGIVPLISSLRSTGAAFRQRRKYLDTILTACSQVFGDASLFDAEEPISALSQRELEVLRLIDAGYSNRRIATKLVISLHTAKKHTSNIYSKLGVGSRTQAVARGRELGLL